MDGWQIDVAEKIVQHDVYCGKRLVLPDDYHIRVAIAVGIIPVEGFARLRRPHIVAQVHESAHGIGIGGNIGNGIKPRAWDHG